MPATQRYCAFLRAINVGGHTVKMDQLRALVEQLGYTNVATYIASGNVMFDAPDDDAPALEAQIERHLHAALGYEVTTFLRTAGELAAVAAHTPFPAETGSVHGLYVSFLKAPLADAVQQRVLALGSDTDAFHMHGRELYWLCRVRLSDSPLFSGTLLPKTIGVPTTMRNITTVRKLAAKFARPG